MSIAQLTYLIGHNYHGQVFHAYEYDRLKINIFCDLLNNCYPFSEL